MVIHSEPGWVFLYFSRFCLLHFHLPVGIYWIKAVYGNLQEDGRLWPQTSTAASSVCLIALYTIAGACNIHQTQLPLAKCR